MKPVIPSVLVFTTLFTAQVFGGTNIKGSISVGKERSSTYASKAKITMIEAISIASKNSDGKVIEVALEKEDGFLVYEVEVLGKDGKKSELLIDAGNGSILKTEKDEDHE